MPSGAGENTALSRPSNGLKPEIYRRSPPDLPILHALLDLHFDRRTVPHVLDVWAVLAFLPEQCIYQQGCKEGSLDSDTQSRLVLGIRDKAAQCCMLRVQRSSKQRAARALHGVLTCIWNCWYMPGPICLVTILFLQLHFLFPGAGLTTFLSRHTWAAQRGQGHIAHQQRSPCRAHMLQI